MRADGGVTKFDGANERTFDSGGGVLDKFIECMVGVSNMLCSDSCASRIRSSGGKIDWAISLLKSTTMHTI